MPARVALEHTHIYRVLTADGEWLARVSGRLRHEAAQRADFPAVGDWVARRAAGDRRRRADPAVLPRSSRFSRRAAGDPTEEQVVAANIDIVFLVSGLDHDFNPRRIERYLVVAWDSGAAPVIVLNKADLVDGPARSSPRSRRWRQASPVHAVSCTRSPSDVGAARRTSAPGGPARCSDRRAWGSRRSSTALIGEELLRDARGARMPTAAGGTRRPRGSWCCCRAAAC